MKKILKNTKTFKTLKSVKSYAIELPRPIFEIASLIWSNDGTLLSPSVDGFLGCSGEFLALEVCFLNLKLSISLRLILLSMICLYLV